jgi:Tfp pilus assembly protein PilF
VAWFFGCILLTHFEIWKIGNVAHGAGAIQGILLGFASSRPRWRPIYVSLSLLVLIVVFIAAAFGQPYCNFSEDGRKFYAQSRAFHAYEQLVAGNHERAVHLYLVALKIDRSDATSWHNLGISYQHLGRIDDAEKAYRHALEINPNEKGFHASLEAIRKFQAQRKSSLAYEKQLAGHHERAVDLYLEALNFDKNDARSWYNLGISYQHLGRMDDAAKAYQRAVEFNPNDERFRAALEAVRDRK